MVAPKRSEGERSEPERSEGATIPTPAVEPSGPGRTAVDPEVTAKAVRRQFTAAYKRRVLEEADQCDPGGIAALLRREGLYSSHLNTWRKQREAGEIAGLEPRKRGKKPVPRNPLAGECERLKRENARLQNRLKQAETIIDVQKKLCEMLGLPVATTDINGSDE
jgi:transposase-like protein